MHSSLALANTMTKIYNVMVTNKYHHKYALLCVENVLIIAMKIWNTSIVGKSL